MFAVRLLSLINQLDRTTRNVTLNFEDSENPVMPYLNRIGFFESLVANVIVLRNER
jgi:hypothetical protein